MATDPIALAKATMQYGPAVQNYARRSQYLADALRAIGETSNNIQTPAELGTKLLATAILQRGVKKAERGTTEALQAYRDDETARALAGLKPPSPQPTAAVPPIPALPPAPSPPPMAAATAPVQQPGPAPAQYSPEDADALTRMIATEAIGEGPQGMAAAGHVALNRLNSGYGGAKSLRDVVFQPHQFEGMSRAGQVKPDDYARARQVAEGLLSGQIPDPTGGAINFLNPELQAQLGRPQPSWAPQGQGQRIGRHVFYGGNPGTPPPPPPPNPNGPPVQNVAQPSPIADQPFQVAANGPLQPGMMPSAPAASLAPAAGAPPVAPQLPQVSAAGGSGGPTTMQVTPEQLTLVERLLKDPRTHDVGMAYAMDLQKKLAEPVKYDSTSFNGVPGQINPYTGDARVVALPDAARTQTIPTPPGLPQGAIVQQKPTGEQSILYQPPSGYQGSPTQQTYVRGGPQDPAAGANLVAGEGKLRDDYAKEIQPYMVAREGYQKVIEAARTGNPAGDIALVFGYMKTLDPGSTVREGEQAQVANSGTIPQTVTNIYNKLLTGQGSLSPAQRAQFADSAGKQFQVYQRTFDAANKRYGDIASSYGFDPTRVIRQFDPIEGFHPPAAAAAPTGNAAAYQQMFRKGQIDPKAPLGSSRNPFNARDDATVRALDTPQNRGKHIVMPDGSLGVIE